MQQVLIALNPHAGAESAAERVDQLARLLAGAGLQPHIETDLEQFTTGVAQLQAAGELHSVVAAGGDGTAAEVVNRLPPGVAIALFPLGTENLLSRAIGQTATPQAVFETLTAGERVDFDAGSANGRLFLTVLGAGFDAAVVERAHQLRRGHINHWHYFRPIQEAIRRYHFAELKITATKAGAEPETVTWSARWAFVFNLPSYAARLPIAPQAVGTDGALDLCTFRRGSFWHGLRYLASVILKRHQRLADYSALRVTRLRIECDEPAPYQLDGDPGGQLPVEVEVLPARVRLIIPPRTR